MSESTTIDQEFIERAKLLVKWSEEGKEEEVNNLLDEMTASRETSLYRELGKLTRDFHEALSEFSGDSRLMELTNNEIADATERLNFVVSKTKQAADVTMTHVENSIPLCESLVNSATDIATSWERLTKKEMKPEEFRELSKKIKGFLEAANKDGETLKQNLNEVLMAQDFQDITGQVIFRVIKLVEDVETSMVNLIRIASKHISVEGNSKQPEQKDTKNSLDGPVIPGLADEQETVSGQDEVDDLLSSLGF